MLSNQLGNSYEVESRGKSGDSKARGDEPGLSCKVRLAAAT